LLLLNALAWQARIAVWQALAEGQQVGSIYFRFNSLSCRSASQLLGTVTHIHRPADIVSAIRPGLDNCHTATDCVLTTILPPA